MLVIKIDIEKNNENYAAVLDALTQADYNVISMSWEAPSVKRPVRSSDDLGKNLSAAIDNVQGS